MSASAPLQRARAALDLGRYDDAAREAGLAVAADPESPDGYYLLARSLFGLKQHREALGAIDTALTKQPDRPILHCCRSDILRSLDDLDGSMAAAEECLRLEPHGFAGHYAVGLTALQAGDLDRAEEVFRRAIGVSPSTAVLHFWLGDTLRARGQPALAEQCYRRALALEPNDAECLNNLGVVLEDQGKRQEAALAYKSAVLVDPTLRVAKENTHRTLRKILGPLGALGAGGLVLALKGLASSKAVLWGLFVSARALVTPAGWGYALGTVVLIAAVVVGRLLWSRWRLRRRDPALLSLYHKLEADKQAGRL